MKNNDYKVFLEADVSGYNDEWIAICDGKIVSHGKNIKAVLLEANEKCPNKKPLIAKIPGEETMIF
ncbi:MAG: DUF5678 domain-containing protein [Nanoarchaeota archaeon]|nr:DUF5678 domain-containing protein [Nanoarchaeota archaeon]